MGKSAKFYKRPTRKEKMGLSSNSNIRAAIASSKFNKVEPITIVPKHEPKISINHQSSESKPFSLIQDPSTENIHHLNDDIDMQVDENSIKKKKQGLKSKLNKNPNKSIQTPNDQKRDYVDLYDKPDRRKKSNRKK